MLHMPQNEVVRKKFDTRKSLTVHLEEAELKWVELQADGNISEWCREKLLADFNGAEPRRAVGAPEKKGHRSRPKMVEEHAQGPHVDAPLSAEMPTAPTKIAIAGICVCGHPKHKHGGFKGCCQADMCTCSGYN
jgi:hypothetical protein